MVQFIKFYAVPPPEVSILKPSTIPYNGTVFTLTGIVQLDPRVDTNVTVLGQWSGSSDPEEAISAPYSTSLLFQPLATNSSGIYTLTVAVRPSDNSPYIVGSSGSNNCSLTVKRKFKTP